MPILIQICIAVSTVALVVAAIALTRVLAQMRHTAAQVERTMVTLDQAIPSLVRTVDEARGVLDSVNHIVARADRMTGDLEIVGGKAARLSTLVVDQVLAPAAQVAALVSGVRTGASFLFDGWLKHRSSKDQPSSGGYPHE
ncbi:MAG: hypothetical protein ABI960_09770 [Candidatus Eisenbacteria bacterium]